MLKKIIIMAFTFPAIGFAQLGEQIVKQIEKVNSSRPGVPKVADPCSNCAAQKSLSSVFEACVKKVCAEKGLVSFAEIPKISAEALAKPAANEEQMEAVFDKLTSIQSPLDTEVERGKLYDLLRSGKLATTEENLEVALQFFVINVGGRSIKWNDKTYRAEFDEEKFKKINLPLSQENKVAMEKKVKAFIAGLPSALELSNQGIDNSDSYLARQYPGLSKVQAVKKLTSDFRSELESFHKSGLGKLLSRIADGELLFPEELVAEIESGIDITDASLRDLIAAKTSFKSTMKFFSASEGSPIKFDFDDLRKRLSEPIRTSKIIENDKSRNANQAKVKDDAKVSCLSTYRRNLLILPSPEKIAVLKKTIEEIKKDVSEKWASKYSSHTQKKIDEYLKDVEFYLPLTREEYSAGFKQRIQREILVKTRKAEIKVKDRESLAFFLALSDFVKEFSDPVGEKEKNTNELTELCEKDKASALNDANYTLLGKIQVSYTSAHALEMGKGVVAHELGHGISQIFKSKSTSEGSAKKHQGFLSCLAAQHGAKGEQYVEEDYADWLAANITTANHSCLFPQNYSPGSKQVENSSKSDTHSSDFFRLLHVESIQQGKIPSECNTVLVEQGTPKDFHSCQKLIHAKEDAIR